MTVVIPDCAYTEFVRRQKRGVRIRVLHRDMHACVWCSTPLTAETITLDHVLLKSKNGSQWEGNLVAACAGCNGERGNTDWREWYSRCESLGNQMRKGLYKQLIKRSHDPRATRHGLMMYLGMDTAGIKAYFDAKEALAAEKAEKLRRQRTKARNRRERRAGRQPLAV